MLKCLCAWSLVVLAISPFTAPYATCDLAVFLSHAPRTGRIVESGDAFSTTIDIEALSVSPVVERILLTNPLVAAAPPPAPATACGNELTDLHISATLFAPHDPDQAPQEYFAQPTVLRL